MKTCTASNCDRPTYRGRALCSGHVSRKAKGQPLAPPLRRWRPKDSPSRPPCSVVGCYRPEKGNKGICAGHLRRRDIQKFEDWARPLKVYRKAGQTHDVSARVPKDVAEALTRRARLEGLDRSDFICRILTAHVRGALMREVA